MNKIIILENNGGRLANQLWQFICIYAYCLEKGYSCENYCFFRYARYFNLTISNKFVYWLFFKSYGWYQNIKVFKILYIIYATLIKKIFRKKIVIDGRPGFTLPPSNNLDVTQKQILKIIDSKQRGVAENWYFCGWLFFNPEGLKKYHDQIVSYFKPKDVYLKQIAAFVQKLRGENKKLVGLHIRQGDFKTWMDGKYYFSPQEVKKILDDFLVKQNEFTKDNTIFVLCSDGYVDERIFAGLNVVRGPGSEITDLFTLAATDLIIGNPASSYGSWAGYYGNVPIIEFSRETIDWSVKTIKYSQ